MGRLASKPVRVEFKRLRAFYARDYGQTAAGMQFLECLAKPRPPQPRSRSPVSVVTRLGHLAIVNPAAALIALTSIPVLASAAKIFRTVQERDKTVYQLRLEGQIIEARRSLDATNKSSMTAAYFVGVLTVLSFLCFANLFGAGTFLQHSIKELRPNLSPPPTVVLSEIGSVTDAVAVPTPTSTGAMIVGSKKTPGFAELVADSKRKAVQKYPDLGVAGTAMNTHFLGIYREWQSRRDARFAFPEWPERIADECQTSTGR